MFVININGGLGNQMFQYALGRSLSIAYNSEFKLDNNFFKGQSLRSFELDCFELTFNIANENCIRKLKGNNHYYMKVLKKLGFSLNKIGSYFKEKRNPEIELAIFELKKDMYLDGSWQNEEYFKNIRDVIVSDFTVKEELVPKNLKSSSKI